MSVLKEFTNFELMQEIAERERAEQIANAEAAFRRGEITAEFLAWYRTFTAKVILERDTPQKAG